MPAPGGTGTYNPGAPPPGGFYSLGGGDKVFGNLDPSSGYYYTKQYSGKPGESIAEAMGSLAVRPELMDQGWAGAKSSGMRWGYDPAVNAKRWGYDNQVTVDSDYRNAAQPGQVQGYDYGKNMNTWINPGDKNFGGTPGSSQYSGENSALKSFGQRKPWQPGMNPGDQYTGLPAKPNALSQMQPKPPKTPKAPGLNSLAPTGGGTRFEPAGPQGAGGPEGVFSSMFNKKVFPGSQG